MTEKESSIINSAISLFAQDGYDGTSTRLIAKKAGVSEGLIFKHFKNKRGLLEKLIMMGENQIQMMIKPIESLTHPKVILKHILTIPLNIGVNEKKLFTLIFSMRWKIDDNRMDLLNVFKPKILNSFKALNYDDPISETRSFLMVLDGAMLYTLQRDSKYDSLILNNLLNKFDL